MRPHSAIADAPYGEPVQVEARVVDVSVQFRPRRQLVARVRDDAPAAANWCCASSTSTAVRRSSSKRRDSGRPLRLFGEIRQGFLGPEMVHPRYRVVDEDAALPGPALTPVYPTTAGVSQAALRFDRGRWRGRSGRTARRALLRAPGLCPVCRASASAHRRPARRSAPCDARASGVASHQVRRTAGAVIAAPRLSGPPRAERVRRCCPARALSLRHSGACPLRSLRHSSVSFARSPPT